MKVNWKEEEAKKYFSPQIHIHVKIVFSLDQATKRSFVRQLDLAKSFQQICFQVHILAAAADPQK